MQLGFSVFLACLMSFFSMLLLCPVWIWWWRQKKLGEPTDKSDSEKLNQLHKKKKGTPTMGGVPLLLTAVFWTLVLGKWQFYSLLSLSAILLFALIGFYDDWVKLHKVKKGLSAREKFLAQCFVAFFLVLSLYLYQGEYFLYTLGGETVISLLPFWILFAVFVVVGSSNAVNLTDGLDGLAAGVALPVYFALLALTYSSGVPEFAKELWIPYQPEVQSLTILIGALLGSLLGFLWFNCHPAQVFMGDTGSLPLGALLGLIALILDAPFLLLFLAGVFVAETLSVILQVLSYRIWRKRIFRIAPLHHHFQFGGLSESKITVRFWIVSFLCALVALVLGSSL